MFRGTAMVPAKTNRGQTNIDPLREFERNLNRLFGENFGFIPEVEEGLSLKTWLPVCDIFETEKNIVVKAELPEVKKENVKVSVENNVLTITGERKFEEETRRENFHRVERRYGEFMRSFTLPNFIDTAHISAEFKEGMLNITLPKRAEAQPKQVEVAVK